MVNDSKMPGLDFEWTKQVTSGEIKYSVVNAMPLAL